MSATRPCASDRRAPSTLVGAAAAPHDCQGEAGGGIFLSECGIGDGCVKMSGEGCGGGGEGLGGEFYGGVGGGE